MITCGGGQAARGRRSGIFMSPIMRPDAGAPPLADHEQKHAALSYLQEALAEARLDGVDEDCFAQACIFAAFSEWVATYGEDAAAAFAERLAPRIRNGEFSLPPIRQ